MTSQLENSTIIKKTNQLTSVAMKEKTFNCIVCSNAFTTTSKKPAKCCSESCRAALRRDKKVSGIEGIDYIKCPVCNQKMKQINNVHARMHGFSSPREMRDKLGMPNLFCESSKLIGDKNPAANHNGRYSKWSKNFIHGYDKDAHEEFAAKHSAIRQNKNKKHMYMTNIEYWINQTEGDIEEAKKRYTKFQTRDLAYFIEKYGEEAGKSKHAAKINKWLTVLNNKTDAEKLEINRKKIWKNGFSSKGEVELLNALKDCLKDKTFRHQLMIKKNIGIGWYLFDIVLDNKIIEYNGDYWHANSNRYKDNDIFKRGNKNITAKDIWNADKEKIECAIKNNYEVFIVWESDYKKDKQKVINECLTFLTA